ncbi:hypothetical protein CKO11_11315 [Rhodobacter sp. TJ_12]|nr:hypothetical protein [Rhodobacter sp. TJ_12]
MNRAARGNDAPFRATSVQTARAKAGGRDRSARESPTPHPARHRHWANPDTWCRPTGRSREFRPARLRGACVQSRARAHRHIPPGRVAPRAPRRPGSTYRKTTAPAPRPPAPRPAGPSTGPRPPASRQAPCAKMICSPADGFFAKS